MLDEAVAFTGRRIEQHVDAAVDRARDKKQPVEQAARRALDEALRTTPQPAAAPPKPKRKWTYEIGPDGLPTPVSFVEV